MLILGLKGLSPFLLTFSPFGPGSPGGPTCETKELLWTELQGNCQNLKTKIYGISATFSNFKS